MQQGQHEIEGNSIVLSDNDNVLTKRQRKSKTCPAGMILNEPINSKSNKGICSRAITELMVRLLFIMTTNFLNYKRKDKF